MLKQNIFKTIIENTPLVSIDICLVCDGKMLLGKRNNEPLKDKWFTPGGRIYKNETWQQCIRRIAHSELGISIGDLPTLKLMGVWDHFYENSFLDNNISTHYVNLPHYCILGSRLKLSNDHQHDILSWFDLREIADNKIFHKYIQNYASFLINMEKKL